MVQPKTLSSGVVIMRRIDAAPHFLLLRAYNYWDFPKGLVETGEDPFEAAKREVLEETSLDRLTFNWGYDYRETPPYRHGKVARYYVAESVAGKVFLQVNPDLGHPEHDEFRWLLYQEARELLADRVKPILDWARTVITLA